MHSLDVNAALGVLRRTDVCGRVTGRERYSPTVVDIYPVRRRRGEFVPVERGVGPRDD